MSLNEDLNARIESLIATDRVVLFMKGTRTQPQCGFSATVVGILDNVVPDYHTVNVLEDQAVREGIKAYSDWPTIPQLYIEREFVGGCDVVQQMYASGDLHRALGLEPVTVEPPAITISDAAAQAIREAMAGQPGAALHLRIDPSFNHQFGAAPAKGHEIAVTANGLEVLLDVDSAARADGLEIDMTETPEGAGFVIRNPNAPPPAPQMSVAELKRRMDAGEPFYLFDVRGEDERAIASIEGARTLDEAAVELIGTLDSDTPLVFHCHSGVRSQSAADYFRQHGYTQAYNLAGGIDAWSAEIDPSVPRY